MQQQQIQQTSSKVGYNTRSTTAAAAALAAKQPNRHQSEGGSGVAATGQSSIGVFDFSLLVSDNKLKL
jgi:hypothetical protein